MKKLTLGMGSLVAVAIPVSAVVACGEEDPGTQPPAGHPDWLPGQSVYLNPRERDAAKHTLDTSAYLPGLDGRKFVTKSIEKSKDGNTQWFKITSQLKADNSQEVVVKVGFDNETNPLKLKIVSVEVLSIGTHTSLLTLDDSNKFLAAIVNGQAPTNAITGIPANYNYATSLVQLKSLLDDLDTAITLAP